MGNIFNEDFREFIEWLNKEEVEYMLAGGYSVILHGYSRTTGDMDIWVNVTRENLVKLKKACIGFGLPTEDLTEHNFLKNDNIDVFTYGRPPVSIDIMKKVKGLSFTEAYKEAVSFQVENVKIRVLSREDLMKAKKASNRPKDQDDIEQLAGE